jgi:hypothetical protein
MEGTAIPADHDFEGEVAAVSAKRCLAVLAVFFVAVALAVLPGAVALGLAPAGLTAALAAGGALAAVVGGVKWAAVVWGLASRGSDPGLRAAGPVIE